MTSAKASSHCCKCKSETEHELGGCQHLDEGRCKPHKHAALIKAWADNQSLQIELFLHGKWYGFKGTNYSDHWNPEIPHRIKPQQEHKWHLVMLAYAEGKDIQVRVENSEWYTFQRRGDKQPPKWDWPDSEWRVKPEPISLYTRVETSPKCLHTWNHVKAYYHNIKATFDPDSKELLSVEKL